MSLINFLNSKLKPAVECDGVWEDGFAASNLIADDEEQLSRGFMGYSVSKPPVEIIFDFPKAIDLKVIKLWNTNGALRSTSFELHSKIEGIWERVAFVRDLAKGVESITFCIQSDYNSRSNAENAAAQQQCAKAFFFRSAHKVLANTNSIKIVIRATHKCPPVLRKAQVWGLPSRTLEKVDRELVKTIWNEITNPYDEQTQQAGQRSPARSAPELHEDSTLQIPEQFLDAITWELMIFPTVLPSGKVVDQSTIDRHSEVEAKWGRTPSDPFTGLEFTSERKAILNLALKARIEKYLMENADHFKAVPRSLGSSRVRRSKNRHASQFASLCQTHTSGAYSTLTGKHKSKFAATATTMFSADFSSDQWFEQPAYKRKKLSSAAFAAELHKSMCTTTTTHATDTNLFTTSMCGAAANVSAAAATILPLTAAAADDALQQALRKVTRFTRPPAETKPDRCVRCKSAHFAYEIQTCKHLVCRGCLIQLTQKQMCACKTSFCSADVERYHRI